MKSLTAWPNNLIFESMLYTKNIDEKHTRLEEVKSHIAGQVLVDGHGVSTSAVVVVVKDDKITSFSISGDKMEKVFADGGSVLDIILKSDEERGIPNRAWNLVKLKRYHELLKIIFSLFSKLTKLTDEEMELLKNSTAEFGDLQQEMFPGTYTHTCALFNANNVALILLIPSLYTSSRRLGHELPPHAHLRAHDRYASPPWQLATSLESGVGGPQRRFQTGDRKLLSTWVQTRGIDGKIRHGAFHEDVAIQPQRELIRARRLAR
jgi:hypothetical protein